MHCIVVFLLVCLCLLSVLSFPLCLFFCLRLFLSVFVGRAKPPIMCPLRANVTWLTSLAPARQILFLVFGWLFGRARTTNNGHPRLALPDSRAPTRNYIPPRPYTPINAHHGHAWTSLTHSPRHVMFFCILACLLCCTWWSCVRVWCVCLRVLGCFPLVHAHNLTLNTYAYVALPFLSLYSLVR